MDKDHSKLGIVRALGGEGGFRNHRLVANGRALIVCLKLLRTTFFFATSRGRPASSGVLVLVKGDNQHRLFRRQYDDLVSEFGNLDVRAISRLKRPAKFASLPRLPLAHVIKLMYAIMLLLFTRKSRHLCVFYLVFFHAIQISLERGFPCLETLICYNDQPFDAAAIVHAANLRARTLTITLQHGLILSPEFYFPIRAQQFRAWGELSQREGQAFGCEGVLTVVGRYRSDRLKLAPHFRRFNRISSPLSILAAPSFNCSEIYDLADKIRAKVIAGSAVRMEIAFKLHPATKCVAKAKRKIGQILPGISYENDDMETLAERFDLLITRNSTSAVDFLLLGKPVVFLEQEAGTAFPSSTYGFFLNDFALVGSLSDAELAKKNSARLEFLRSALNV